MSDDELKKKIMQTGIQKKLESIRDDFVNEFRDTTRFHFVTRRLKTEGYHPRFFDSKYIDFIAYQGKLEDSNVKCGYIWSEWSELPEIFKDDGDYHRCMENGFGDEFYVLVHENGEFVLILNDGEPCEEEFNMFPWIRNVNLTKMNENEVLDFFSRNKDIPVKYKF